MEYLTNINDIQNLYNSNRNNKEYETYEKYLSIYFEKPSSKDIYTRSYEDGKFILTEIKNPKKKISIESAKYTNLFDLYKNLKLYNDIILDKISLLIEKPTNINDNDREKFKELKENYVLYNKKVQEIDELNKNHLEKLEKLIIDKIDESLLMAKYYNERNLIFKEIKNEIPKTSKDEIIKLFHNHKNKIPEQSIINKTAKILEIPSNDIENWLKWVEKCYQYLMIKKSIYQKISEIEEINKNFKYRFENFIIKKPIIEN